MKLSHIMVLSLITVCLIPLARAQEGMSEAEKQAEMQRMMMLAMPGEEHKLLAKMEGSWDQTMKITMAAGQPPMEMKGTSVNKMILGGRFLEITADMKGPMAAQSIMILGFDRRHEKFTSIGFDTMGTYSVSATGSYDAANQTIKMYGEDQEVKFVQKYYFNFRMISDDEFVVDVIFVDHPAYGKGEKKVVEVVSKRRAS